MQSRSSSPRIPCLLDAHWTTTSGTRLGYAIRRTLSPSTRINRNILHLHHRAVHTCSWRHKVQRKRGRLAQEAHVNLRLQSQKTQHPGCRKWLWLHTRWSGWSSHMIKVKLRRNTNQQQRPCNMRDDEMHNVRCGIDEARLGPSCADVVLPQLVAR